MQIFRAMLILSFSMFLTGCPVPTTNTVGMNQPNSAPLPHPVNPHKALIYLVQPTFEMDLYLVAGTLSEGFEYHGSDVYIQSRSLGAKRYLGELYYEKMICFYADPGLYHFYFYNKGGIPETMQQTVNLDASQVYFYGLSNKNTKFSTKSNLEFNQLTINTGKNYLAWYKQHQALPAECRDVTGLANRPPKTYYVLNISNASDVTYKIKRQNSSEGDIKLGPNENHQFTLESQTYFAFANQDNQKTTSLRATLNIHKPGEFSLDFSVIAPTAADINNTNLWNYLGSVPGSAPNPNPITKVPHHVLLANNRCVLTHKSIDAYFVCDATIQNQDDGKGAPIY